MIRRLAHLCFNTDQLAEMRAFYEGVMGLGVKFRFENGAGETFGYYFECGDSSFIEVFDRVKSAQHWGGTPRELAAGTQYAHFCLEVTGLKELKAALEAKGVKVTEVRQGMDHSLQAWVKDPDGNAIELMEYTAGSLEIRREAGLVAK